jgi:hypothetical protein
MRENMERILGKVNKLKSSLKRLSKGKDQDSTHDEGALMAWATNPASTANSKGKGETKKTASDALDDLEKHINDFQSEVDICGHERRQDRT